ncbi:MAG: hypothetical protein ACRET5_10960, partial [Steroidobacteraceae bacterium]
MSPSLASLRRHFTWIPALLVFATVAMAGSRLIVLSVQRRAEEARNAAQADAARSAHAIERQIDGLAQRAASARRRDSNTFEWAGDGSILASGPAAATARALVSEWQAAAPAGGIPAAALLGPVREGSEWLMAARAPLHGAAADGSAHAGGWTVAYARLDTLLH